MNSDVVPAAIAAAGGTVMAGVIYVSERRRDEAMRASRVRLALRLPARVEPRQVEAMLSMLVGLGDDVEVVAELVAVQGSTTYALWVPQASCEAVVSLLAASIPGVRVSEEEPVAESGSTGALRVFVPTPTILREDDPDVVVRALLSTATRLRPAEAVTIRWALRPRDSRPWAPRADDARSQDLKRAWERKTDRSGVRAAGLVLVRAASRERTDALLSQVTAALRGRYATGHHLRLTVEHTNRSMIALPQVRASSGWLNVAELTGLLGWPIGTVSVPGIDVGASRELMADRRIPRKGRRLLTARDSLGERTVALSEEAARHHLVVVGPTGVGKSVLLARSILDDLANGYGGFALDAKADTVTEVLEHVRPEDADRVVVLDPSAPGPVPGLDLFATGDPDLRADVVVGALSGIFHKHWGPRSDYYARLGLRTLADVPGATLADLGRLFFEDSYRRAALSRLSDPMLRSAWAAFEAMSPAERSTHVQAPMARVLQLLMRPALRAVLAQSNPQLDIGRLLAQRKFILAPVSPGTLGEPAARLLSAVLMYSVWAAIEARAALPPERRVPTFLYVDELATLASLPISIDLLAERARGLGAGLTVALQSLARVPDHTRAALLGNVASLITFRAGPTEAARIAAEIPGMSAEDIQLLGRFEVAARVGLGVGNEVTSVTGHTEPLGAPTGQGAAIRRRTAERYGGEPQTTAPDPQPTGDVEPVQEAVIGRVRRSR